MAIAKQAVEITIYAEGNERTAVNSFGLQDNFLRDNLKYTGVGDKAQVKTQAQAVQIMAKVFDGRGFGKINNQDAANFFWDCYFHNPTIYRALCCALFEEKTRFVNMVNKGEVTPDWLMDDINQTENTNDMLAAALWLRRRLARVYWRENLWNGFDKKRFSLFPHRLFSYTCFPSNLKDKLIVAADYVLNVGNYYNPKQYPNRKSSTEIQLILEKTNLPLATVDTSDTYRIGIPYNYKGCNQIQQPTPPESNDNIILVFAAAIALKLLKVW